MNDKLNEYIVLSSDKSQRSYDKYFKQYNDIYNSLNEENKLGKSILFSVLSNEDFTIIKTNKSNVNQLSVADVKEIIMNVYKCKDPIIYVDGSNLCIKIKK
ncbi:MAG: hypothetical protein ACRCXA_06690 [Peptostreptococcaceae bacterium]